REQQDPEKDEELEEPEPRELVEDHGQRVEEDDLDVEEDEEHRCQVEVDGEALRARRSLRDAGLERDPPLAHPSRGSLREDEAEDDHRRRDRKCEQPVDRKRQPVVEHASSPGDPGVRTLPRLETAPPGKPCAMKTLLRGLVAGLVGTGAMSAAQFAAAKLRGRSFGMS